MAFENIHNMYESLVYAEMDRHANKHSIDLELDAYEDVACIALNALPPRYIKHDVDAFMKMTEKEETELLANVRSAVVAAYKKVMDKPNHEDAA
ncbi:MAG: late competence development ComFB family protein [Gammaproteobacteria bacterium]|nr:late competence development ComFB family protein [Gammaproteobacteria bacterium]MDH5692476.1 late competence development ComFB family protein [Gammaproteobacteria bacterium]